MARRTPKIDKVTSQTLAIVRDALGERERVAGLAFARLFLADVPAVDFVDRHAGDLAGAALGLWRLARQARRGSAPKIRAFNPRAKPDLWTSPHTVVEIVADDSPFLVDSLTTAFNQMGLTVHLVVHPVAAVRRVRGVIHGLRVASRGPGGTDGAVTESFMHFQVDQRTRPVTLRKIEREAVRVLADVATAVGDWAAMKARLGEAIAELGRLADGRAVKKGSELRDRADEAVSFLKWIADDNFTLLGLREYRFAGKRHILETRRGALGLLGNAENLVFENWHEGLALPREAKAYIDRPDIVALAKSHRRSTVHRPVFFDVIDIKIFDGQGRVSGELFVLGLFTSAAYSRNPLSIPMLKQKVRRVEAMSDFDRSGHSYKALVHILVTYPRDELFQIDEKSLLDNALGILDLQQRQHVALFLRKDVQGRFISCLVYIPRERFHTSLRKRLASILEHALGGMLIDYTPEFGTESKMVRVLYLIKTKAGAKHRINIKRLTAAMTEATLTWEDRLKDALSAAHGEEAGLDLLRRYRGAFGSGYQDRYDAVETIGDIARIDAALAGSPLELNLYRRTDDPPELLRLKLYSPGRALPLSDVLPMLENMGLKVVGEVPNKILVASAGRSVWVHDFSATLNGAGQDGPVPRVNLAAARELFHDAFLRIFTGQTENDGFNRLVLQAGLTWRQIVILRAACKYLLQTRIAWSQAYMEESLAANPSIAKLIVSLFETRFDPDRGPGKVKAKADMDRRQSASRAIATRIESALDNVASLDEDRILRRFTDLVGAILRTNYYQPAVGHRTTIAFKIDASSVEGLPDPRPWVEIFVYAPDMEGCHLRGGPVA
ncbi:MAG: NAD-glutamate dehydrogenase, partial [Alphaproteobacteria bacterium]|nr:NAD-glutamate dehydrogenase [Alphaproteobacteria bacterium]